MPLRPYRRGGAMPVRRVEAEHGPSRPDLIKLGAISAVSLRYAPHLGDQVVLVPATAGAHDVKGLAAHPLLARMPRLRQGPPLGMGVVALAVHVRQASVDVEHSEHVHVVKRADVLDQPCLAAHGLSGPVVGIRGVMALAEPAHEVDALQPTGVVPSRLLQGGRVGVHLLVLRHVLEIRIVDRARLDDCPGHRGHGANERRHPRLPGPGTVPISVELRGTVPVIDGLEHDVRGVPPPAGRDEGVLQHRHLPLGPREDQVLVGHLRVLDVQSDPATRPGVDHVLHRGGDRVLEDHRLRAVVQPRIGQSVAGSVGDEQSAAGEVSYVTESRAAMAHDNPWRAVPHPHLGDDGVILCGLEERLHAYR